MKRTITKSIYLARQCSQLSDNDDMDTKTRAQNLDKWFAGQVRIPIFPLSTNQVLGGIVKRLPLDKSDSYGFIRGEDKEEFFFQRGDMKNPNDWPLLSNGTRVTFIIGVDPRGPRAIAVDLEDTNRQPGTITGLPPGQEYGFIRAVNGTEYFFHFKSILAPKDAKPQLGDRVKFALGANRQGPCAVDVTIE
jgi:cold shock CspA family protein